MTSCMVHRGNVIPVKTEITKSTGLIAENCVYFYILALDQYYDLRRFDPAIKSLFFLSITFEFTCTCTHSLNKNWGIYDSFGATVHLS